MALKRIDPSEWDTVPKAAAICELPRTTVSSWVAAGHLEAVPLASKKTTVVRISDVRKLKGKPPLRGKPSHRSG